MYLKKKKRKCFKEEIKIKTGSLNEKYFKPISILFVKSIKESKEKKKHYYSNDKENM